MITYKLMIVCWIKCDYLLSCILSLGNLKFKRTATVRFWRDDRFHLGDIESWDYMTYFCQRCCRVDAQQIIRNSTPRWWTGLPHAPARQVCRSRTPKKDSRVLATAVWMLSVHVTATFLSQSVDPIHRAKWRHGIYGHDTIAILWV